MPQYLMILRPSTVGVVVTSIRLLLNRSLHRLWASCAFWRA